MRLIGAGVAVVLAAAFMWHRARGKQDAMGSFRRQIDALSPESRRHITDQLRRPMQQRSNEFDGQRQRDGEDGS